MSTRERVYVHWLTPFLSSPFCMCVAPMAQHVQRQSATGRIRRGEPGAAPQDSEHLKNASAESAIHFRHQFDALARLKRAFSACVYDDLNSWGDGPASGETARAPLALNRHSFPKGESRVRVRS